MTGWHGKFKDKSCVLCSVVFQPGSGAARYCSALCYSEARRAKECYSTDAQYEKVNKSLRQFFMRLIHGRGRGNAGVRRELSPEFMVAMFEQQNGLCAISGRPMDTVLKRGGSWARCSVDRIDNAKGYMRDNIHLVCKGVNVGRNSQTIEDFIKLCRDIVAHQERKNGQDN